MKPEDEGKKKKKLIEAAIDAGLDLAAKPVKEVIRSIEKRLNNPVDGVVDTIGKLTTLEQLFAIQKKYAKKSAYNLFKDGENLVIAGLSLLPVLGTASTDLVDAAILEGATLEQAGALAKGAQVVDVGEVAYPLSHLIGEKAAGKVEKTLKALNPFEDVPPELVVACGTVGLAVPGVGAVPAGVEMAILTMKNIRNSALMAKEMGSIIAKSPELQSVKNYTRSIIDSVTNRIDRVGTPQMNQARAAFGV